MLDNEKKESRLDGMNNFAEFFEAVTGHKPYKWQMELYSLFICDELEEVLEAKTGAGKTAIILIWYHSLMTQMRSDYRTVPMRLHYLISRRTIVDEVFQFANCMKNVAKKSGFGDLEVIRLRGGLDKRTFNNVGSPAKPVIFVSTIDQYGSRLLMRGYGMSPKMRSFYAGLCFYDSLVVVDESHTAAAILDLFKQIERQQKEKLPGVIMPKLLEMSATPSNNNCFKFDFSDLGHLDKKKPIQITKIKKADDFDRKVAGLVRTGLKKGKKCIIVVVNTVTTARRVFKELTGNENRGNYYLLTGQNRPYRSAQNDMKDLFEFLQKDDDRSETKVVVSTQTIEIGHNFSADMMISEIASLPALIQRSGRLNRFGKMADGEAVFHVVVGHKYKDDPVYGDATAKCLDFLMKQRHFPLDAKQEFLGSEQKLAALLDSDIEKLTFTNPDIPFDVAPYFKGINDYESEVMIVYRDWLPKELNSDVLFTIKGMRVKQAEILRIPMSALLYRTTVDADIDFKRSESGRKKGEQSRFYGRKVVVRRHGKYIIRSLTWGKVRPNDLIFMPTAWGGLDKWGWNRDYHDVYCGDLYNRLPGSKFKHDEWLPNFDTEKNWSMDRLPCGDLYSEPNADYYNKVKSKKGASLELHTQLVEYFCERFLSDLGLNQFKDDFIQAARLHDLGKADPRFQRFLSEKGLIGPVLMAKPLGKLGPRVVPAGWRHEGKSYAIILESGILVSHLTLHLVLTHHGWWRPYSPTVIDYYEDMKDFVLCNKTWTSTKPYCYFINEYFIDLNNEYGPWGLAYLEAIFRLADHAASAYDKEEMPWEK